MRAKPAPSKVRSRILGSTIAGYIVIVLTMWSLLYRGQQAALQEGREHLIRTAHSAEISVNRTLVGLDMFLADLSKWVVQTTPLKPKGKGVLPADSSPVQAHHDNIYGLIRSALNQNLLLRDVALIAADGKALLSARPATLRLGMELPPDFLDDVLAQPFPSLVVSRPISQTLSAERLIYLARSVRMPDGQLLALVAEVHIPLLSGILDVGDSTQGLQVTLERTDGLLLSSQPELESVLGKQLHPSLDELEKQGEVLEGSGRLTLHNGLIAVRPTLYPELMISASLPNEQILSDWYEDRKLTLAIGGMLASALTAVAWMGLVYVRKTTDAQRHVTQSNQSLQLLNAELQQSLALVEATLESTADGVMVVGVDKVISRFNTQFEKLSGVPHSVLSTGNLTEFCTFMTNLVCYPAAFTSLVDKAIAEPGSECSATVEFLDGRTVLFHAMPQIVDTEPIGSVWTYHDITSYKTAERALVAERSAAYEAHANLEATLEALPDLLIEWDATGCLKDYRATQPDIKSLLSSRSLGTSIHEFFPPSAAQEVLAALSEAAVMRHSYGHQIQLPLGHGIRWFELSIARKTGVAPSPDSYVSIWRDITDRKNAEEELMQAALVYQSSSEAMVITNAIGEVQAVNPAFTKITGYGSDEVLGIRLVALKADPHEPLVAQNMWHAVMSTGQWQGEIWTTRKSGERYAETLIVNTIFDPDGLPRQRIALFSDITQRKSQEQLIWNQAHFDGLTGLPNRRMFREHLASALHSARQEHHRTALLFLDLDRFKEINDSHGHDAGDQLLKAAAQRLRTCVRETDLVARLGGDEFTVVVSRIGDTQRLEQMIVSILSKLAEPYRLGKDTEYISASIGYTLYPEDGADADSLIKHADQAMYAAKHAGRNRFERFSVSMQEAAQVRSRIARDLRQALSDHQFWIAYQPIIDLRTGLIHKAEALIRWNHPEQGLIPPSTFIPIAEEAGYIHDIGRWVFETATEQVAKWQTSISRSFQISVNKSPVQFREEALKAKLWTQHLTSKGLDTHSIVLEITEGLLMDASEQTKQHFQRLHQAGVQIALDDFGTGYSALSYLHQIDLHFLKIDQTFVRNLHSGSKDLSVCKASISMAHELGIKVVAEGIETDEQRQLLALAGCDLGQGYLFSRPLPASDFEKFVQAHNQMPRLGNTAS